MKRISKVFIALIGVLALQSMISAPQEKFTLIQLNYSTDALEPVISKETMELHWGKHLRGYVNNLNRLIKGTKFENASLETICKESKGAIYNNAGQIMNHNLYFESLSPNPKKAPSGKLAKAINEKYGSLENYKKEFEKKGTTLFGSGWVWLSQNSDGELIITQEENGGTPVRRGYNPLLGFDVWEHAYYLDYRNRRGEHLSKMWDILDWKVVENRYKNRKR